MSADGPKRRFAALQRYFRSWSTSGHCAEIIDPCQLQHLYSTLKRMQLIFAPANPAVSVFWRRAASTRRTRSIGR